MNTTGFIDLHSDTIMVCNREKLDFINPKTQKPFRWRASNT